MWEEVLKLNLTFEEKIKLAKQRSKIIFSCKLDNFKTSSKKEFLTHLETHPKSEVQN
jgi:hypothetical protein